MMITITMTEIPMTSTRKEAHRPTKTRWLWIAHSSEFCDSNPASRLNEEIFFCVSQDSKWL